MIDRIKRLLEIKDDLQDALLNELIELTKSHLIGLLGIYDVTDIEYIIVEVVVKRYNRLGAEGMASRTIEGLKMDFDVHGDFNDYLPVLKRLYPDAFGKAGIKFL